MDVGVDQVAAKNRDTGNRKGRNGIHDDRTPRLDPVDSALVHCRCR
ncbi:hypothetical protein GCM10009853_079600 [Glycomyces scopariae]